MTDESWHEYFQRLRLEREAYSEGDGSTEKHDTVILIPGRLASDEEIPSPALKLTKTLTNNGWEFKVGYARASKEGDIFKTGDRAGEKREDKVIETCWIDAIHVDRKKRFTASWQTVDGKTTLDSIMHNGSLIKSAELSKLIKGDE
jgi:hypothetical protein